MSTCSTLVVKWQGNANQTYCNNATYFNATVNKRDIVTSTPNCDAAQNCTATFPVLAGAEVIWSVQAISNGSASYPVINALEYPIPPCVAGGNSVSVCGKVFLQGAYDAVPGLMRNNLNTQGLLESFALHHPYNISPFNYQGLDSVNPGFFAAYPGIVDWVLLEVRDANALTSIIARRAVFVKQDGALVDTNGTKARIVFADVAPAKYHVAVRHRNHLGIRTATPVDFNCGNAYVDFTAAGHKSFRSEAYTSPVQMGSVWAMRAGDANGNGLVHYSGPGNDRAAILAGLGMNELTVLAGYHAADLNLNGQVTYSGPGNDRAFLLNPGLIGNELLVYKQQL